MWRQELEAGETGSKEKNQKTVAKAHIRRWTVVLNMTKECGVREGTKVRGVSCRA